MGRAEVPGDLRVTLAYSPRAGAAEEVEVMLPAGATLDEALRASGVLLRHPALAQAGVRVGVWGRVRELATVLRPGDRVEIYRPLEIDPMEARRRRQREQRDASGNRRR